MIYLVTNRHLRPNLEEYLKIIEESVKSGVNRVILREKDLEYKELLELAKKVKDITDKYDIPLIINSNLEVAKSINAYGCHYSFKNFVNKTSKFGVEGVSIHSLKEAKEAEILGANYILAGHIFATDCKKGLKPRGVEFLKELKKEIKIPIVAIGGIEPKNVKAIKASGIENIAIMSYIMTSKNPYNDIKRLKDG